MNKILKILYIYIFISYSNMSYGADMAGYLMQQAIKHYNNQNYEEALTALNNIAPTGDPVAVYLLGNMYLYGYGVKTNHKTAYEMILYASKNLYINNKELAIEAQMTLIEMYIKGKGVIKNNLEAYKWAYVVNLSNEAIVSPIINELENKLSTEEIALASKEGDKFVKDSEENKN